MLPVNYWKTRQLINPTIVNCLLSVVKCKISLFRINRAIFQQNNVEPKERSFYAMFYGIKYFSIKDRNRIEISLGIKVKKGCPFVRKIVPNRINSQYFHSIFLKTGRMLFPSSTITLRTIRKSYGSLVASYREHIRYCDTSV